MSIRNQIVTRIMDNVKLINGGISSFDSSYTYSSNLFNNVYRGFKFFDSINDFPSVYVAGGREERIYNSDGFTEADLPVALRIYHKSSDVQNDVQDIIDDIEHVIYSLTDNPILGIEDITIDTTSTDEGLLEPYGFGEILITVRYVLS